MFSMYVDKVKKSWELVVCLQPRSWLSSSRVLMKHIISYVWFLCSNILVTFKNALYKCWMLYYVEGES